MNPRIGLLEGRMSSELAGLVTRHGGTPVIAPALRESPMDGTDPVAKFIDALSKGEVDVVVFLTGVGASALLHTADTLGRLEELVTGLQRTSNISRGQKPWPPLKRHGIPITVTAPEPYTTAELEVILDSLDLCDRGVAVVHYGERSSAIAEILERCGARIWELCLYEWQMPLDTRPLEALIDEAIAGELDAVAFTSQVQVRHLLQVATSLGKTDALRDALNSHVVTAAVGPTSASALREVGILAKVVPTNPKMGPMVVALAEYLRQQAHGSDRLPASA